MNYCVYGAASNRIDEAYCHAVEELGEKMALRGHTLVFGGGATGLMGAAAKGVHRQGGSIVGVAASFFDVDGVLFPHCTELIYTDTMRQRKATMEARADGFIVTPGGIGTLEEFFEILSLKQLGRHNKPMAVYNINGYYDAMWQMLQNAVDGHFMQECNLTLFRMFTDPDALLTYLETYSDPVAEIPLYRQT